MLVETHASTPTVVLAFFVATPFGSEVSSNELLEASEDDSLSELFGDDDSDLSGLFIPSSTSFSESSFPDDGIFAASSLLSPALHALPVEMTFARG